MPLHTDRGGFDPRFLARALVHQFDLVAVRFGPAAVHAVQHLRPVLAFGAAGAGVYFEEAVIGIRLARQQGFEFLVCRLFLQTDKGCLGFGDDLGIVFCLPHFDQLDAVPEILFERRKILDGFFQVPALAHDLLRPRLVVPKIGVFGFRVQFVQSFGCLVGVKDASSAAPATARSCRPKPAFPPA